MAERKKTVWIVNEGGHDYTDAKQYGSLVPLTKGQVNPFRPDRLALNLGRKLSHAREDDYLLLSGQPILNGLAMSMWLSKFWHVTVLQWSANHNAYEVRRIERKTLIKLVHNDE